MTAVISDTAAAERRAERIRLRLDSIADNITTVLPMIHEAIEKQDHKTLGYNGVSDYVQDRFGGALTRLPVDLRRPVVHELAQAGMSTRAIAPVVGVSRMTAARDVAGVTDVTPAHHAPAPTIPQGEPVSRAVGAGFNTETGEVSDGYLPHDATREEVTPQVGREAVAPTTTERPNVPNGSAAPARPAVVTGLDGKTYTRPEPKPVSAPKRRPITDDARDAGQDLRKVTDRLARIAQDDRLGRNKNEVAAHLRHHLVQALKVCQDLSEYINQSGA